MKSTLCYTVVNMVKKSDVYIYYYVYICVHVLIKIIIRNMSCMSIWLDVFYIS